MLTNIQKIQEWLRSSIQQCENDIEDGIGIKEYTEAELGAYENVLEWIESIIGDESENVSSDNDSTSSDSKSSITDPIKFRIHIRGTSSAARRVPKDFVGDYYELPEFTGSDLEDVTRATCDEVFSNYFDDNLRNAGISGGTMHFEIKDSKLITVTTYNASQRPTEEILDDLVGYTQSQWSDGIGEDYERAPAPGLDGEIHISPWSSEQIVWAEVEEV